MKSESMPSHSLHIAYVQALLPDDYEICGPGEIHNILNGAVYKPDDNALQISFLDAVQAIAAAVTLFQATYQVVAMYKRSRNDSDESITNIDIDEVRNDPSKRQEILRVVQEANSEASLKRQLPTDISDDEAIDKALEIIETHNK